MAGVGGSESTVSFRSPSWSGWLAVALASSAGVCHTPAVGEISPKLGVAVFPLAYKEGLLSPQPIDSAGFLAHLVSTRDRTVEYVFPSGLWFQPPPGPYLYWLEGEGKVSPYPGLMNYSGRVPGPGMMLQAVVTDAGRVTLSAGFTKAPHLVMRLLRGEDHFVGSAPKLEFSRRVPTTEVGEGLVMPVGRVLAAIWDETEQRYSALSRPFFVDKGRTVPAPLEAAPQRRAHLVALVERAKWAQKVDDYRGLRIELVQADRSIEPDVVVQMAERVYVIWYGLAPGSALLGGSTVKEQLAPQTLNLRSETIERVVVKMRERPLLPWEQH
jgi:hypothetical protein